MSSAARSSAALVSPRKHRLPSEARKQQLIEEAIRLFAQRGFSGTRTKDIAAACGVSERQLEAPSVLHYSPGEETRNHYELIESEYAKLMGMVHESDMDTFVRE